MHIKTDGIPADPQDLLKLKKLGFSDQRLAELSGNTATEITAARRAAGIRPVYKRIDSCAAEFPARTPVHVFCYEGDGVNAPECESERRPEIRS